MKIHEGLRVRSWSSLAQAHLRLELDLLLLVEVCVVWELVDVAVVLLPVLEEEQDGAHQQRQRHRHQDRLLGANLKQEVKRGFTQL